MFQRKYLFCDFDHSFAVFGKKFWSHWQNGGKYLLTENMLVNLVLRDQSLPQGLPLVVMNIYHSLEHFSRVYPCLHGCLCMFFNFTFGGWPLNFLWCTSSVRVIPGIIFTLGLLPRWSCCARRDCLYSPCDGSLKPESSWCVGCCLWSGLEYTSGMSLSRVSPVFITGSCSCDDAGSDCALSITMYYHYHYLVFENIHLKWFIICICIGKR